MNLPTIDPAALPQLDRPCAIFGSLPSQGVAATSDSGDIVMMVYVFGSAIGQG